MGEVAFWEVISRASLAVFPEVRNRNETESWSEAFFDSWGLLEFFGPHARTSYRALDVHVIAHPSNRHSPKKICSFSKYFPPFPSGFLFSSIDQIFSCLSTQS